MNYPKKNKLDPFKARILEWVAEGKEQKEILALLKSDGCSCSGSSLSVYLRRERDSQAEDTFLAQITSGAQQNQLFDDALKRSPAPEMKQIMARLKVLTAMISTQAVVNPAVFDQLNILLKHLLDWEKVQTKKVDQALDERRVKLLEEAAERARKTEEVLDSGLSGEDQAARIREIFKKP